MTGLLLSSVAHGDTYRMIMNPQTRKLDWVNRSVSPDSITAKGIGGSVQYKSVTRDTLSGDNTLTYLDNTLAVGVAGGTGNQNVLKVYGDANHISMYETDNTDKEWAFGVNLGSFTVTEVGVNVPFVLKNSIANAFEIDGNVKYFRGTQSRNTGSVAIGGDFAPASKLHVKATGASEVVGLISGDSNAFPTFKIDADNTQGGVLELGSSGTDRQIYNNNGVVQVDGGGDFAFGGDNKKVYWGAGKDAAISYDGTDLVIDSRLVGSGETKFQGGGIYIVNGSANPSGSGVHIKYNGTNGAINCKDFDSPALKALNVGAQTIKLNDANGSSNMYSNQLTHVDGSLRGMTQTFGHATGIWTFGWNNSVTNGDNLLIDFVNGSSSSVKLYSNTGVTNMDINFGLSISNDVSIQGDQFFENNGSGFPYGSMYQTRTDRVITIDSVGVAVSVDDMTVGYTNLSTFNSGVGFSEITVSKAGKYKVDWSLSFAMDAGVNIDIEGVVSVNGVSQDTTVAHRKIGTGTDTGNMGGTGILDLSANDNVGLQVANETSTNNVVIDHANFALFQIGG